MEIKIPIGRQQKEMEERLYIICRLFPELTEEEQKRIADFVIFTYNKHYKGETNNDKSTKKHLLIIYNYYFNMVIT